MMSSVFQCTNKYTMIWNLSPCHNVTITFIGSLVMSGQIIKI